MQIIVFQEGTDDMVVLEVPEDADVFLLLQLIAAETSKDLRNFYLEFEGNPLPMTEMLMNMGILDGSAVILKSKPTQLQSTPYVSRGGVGASSSAVPAQAPLAHSTAAPPSTPTPTPAPATGRPITLYDIPADVKPEELLELTIAHPSLLQQFISNDPELGNCLATRDIVKIRGLMMKRFMNRHKEKYQQEQELKALEADPMNPELQKKIEERVSLSSLLVVEYLF
jgi:hypothetical protein